MTYQTIASAGFMRKLSLLLPLTLVFAAGCSEKGARPGVDPAPEAQAPSAISSSFLVENVVDELDSNRARIAIAKESLGKEFLLQSGLTIMPFLGTSNGNLSRIVTFRVIDGSLWMFDAAQGKIATKDIPQTFVLAKFPIKSQTAKHIYFDFNAGMTDLFVGEEWRASDFSGTDVAPESKAVKTKLSYLEAASITPANELVIRQIAQVDMPAGTVDASSAAISYQQDHTSIEVRYYLTPYAPDANFVSMESPGFSKYGYFEVAPRYDDAGISLVNVSKFNDQPITYAISANTPAEAKDAVRDGILYWNKILGAGHITVVDAPADVTAPDFNYNVVQWVTWDDAGFAYADAQADPRTGQILHAQVYMTSVFWVSGQASAKRWLERVGANPGLTPGPTSHPAGLGLRGFQGSHLCLADMTKEFAQLLTTLIDEEADDLRIKQVASDYIRETIAHEIGHTLGLRHNFAGSQAANFPVSELESIWKDYATSGTAPTDKITSNSVMEYQTFLNSTITGDQLEKATDALAYDRQALTFLYTGAEATGSTPQPFCTDTSESVFVDCKVFDEGFSVSDSLVRLYKNGTRILTTTVDMQENGATVKVPVIYFSDADTIATTLLTPLVDVAGLAAANTKLLRVRQLGGIMPSLQPLIRKTERDTLLAQINAAGGFDVVLPLTVALPDENVASLSGAKANLDARLAAKLVDILAAPTDIVDHELGEAFAVHLEKAARQIALAETGATTAVILTQADGTTTTLNLPEFKYDAKLRAKAAALLQPGRGESPIFAMDQAIKLKADLKLTLDAALGADINAADIEAMPSAARRWLVENQTVLAAFGR